MKTALTILLIFICINSQAQNLVPNWSFEDTISTPCTTYTFSALDSWVLPTQGSTDYYHENCNVFGVPSNVSGYQTAKTGKAYVGLVTYYETSSYREYIKAQLTQPLVAGVKYQWSFWVSRADKKDYASNNLGIYIGPDVADVATLYVLPITPVGNVEVIISDTTNWVQLCGEYVANGGEDYLIIGNFFDNSQTSVTQFQQTDIATINAYYFIDDVYLSSTFINCTDVASIKELNNPTKELIKIIDLLGNETEYKPNTVLIYLYSDGSTEKVFKVE